jgi:hypothetical protein
VDVNARRLNLLQAWQRHGSDEMRWNSEAQWHRQHKVKKPDRAR